MKEPKLIKFDKSNPEHVSNIKSGDFKIHEGGYFSSAKKSAPVKNNDENVSRRAVAKNITTPRKLKPAPEPVKKETAKPSVKKTTKKAPSKKK